MYETLKGEKWEVNRGLAFIKNVPSEATSTKLLESGVRRETLPTRNPRSGYCNLQMPWWPWSLYASMSGGGDSLFISWVFLAVNSDRFIDSLGLCGSQSLWYQEPVL